MGSIRGVTAVALLALAWPCTTLGNGGEVEPVRAGPAFSIASGPAPSGGTYRLVAYRYRHDPEDICVDLRRRYRTSDGHSVYSGFGGCGFGVPRRRRLGVGVGLDCEAGELHLAGPIARSVRRVRVTLRDGAAVNAPRYRSPRGLRFRGRFFLLFLAHDADVRSVEALGASGNRLEITRFRRAEMPRCGDEPPPPASSGLR